MSLFIYDYDENRYAGCHCAECRYAECYYAECRYAECRGAIIMKAVILSIVIMNVIMRSVISPTQNNSCLHYDDSKLVRFKDQKIFFLIFKHP